MKPRAAVALFTTAQRMARLGWNGIRFRLCRMSGKPDRLRSLSLEVTHRCICRCCMCNIWQISSDVPDLSLSAIMELLRSPELRSLRELDLTGGEPFLRPDIGSILQAVCDLQPAHYPELKTVAVTTNGLLTECILGHVGQVIGRLENKNIDLVLACGVDGIGETHDRVRDYPGGWDKLQETLKGLFRIREVHPNLILGIKTTVVPLNVGELGPLSDFARRHNLFTIISPRILTSNRFCNQEMEERLRFGKDDRREMIRFFRSPGFSWTKHRQTLLRYLNDEPLRKACSAGSNTLFIRHNGEVFPCPVISSPLGNIASHALGALYTNAAACAFRKKAGRFAQCAACTEPGMERIAWPCEGFVCLGVAWEHGLGEFNRMIDDTGIDKFLRH